VDFVINEARSGISDATYLFPNKKNNGTIKVATIPLRNLFSKHIDPSEITHLLSVDCEGHDRVVLESNDWDKYRPLVLLVEEDKDRNDNSIEKYLNYWGYSFYSRSGLSAIFVENSIANLNGIKTRNI
jgi:hypothetical protein